MMTGASRFSPTARVAGTVGVVASVIAGWLVWTTPAAFAPAWRCAVFACFGPALGSLVFVLIHQLTGGEWGQALRPFLLGGVRLLPWSWLLLLPLVVSAVRAPAVAGGWGYWTPMGFAGRAVVYGAVFFFLSVMVKRAWPRKGHVDQLAWVGPAGLIALLFLTHLMVSDWLTSLDSHWTSTAFPVVWLIGQAVAGLALAVLVASLGGADPARELGPKRRLGIDWGTLLFATAMLWCYVSFAQYLIVWAGNLPPEASWYTRRLAGAWAIVPPVLVGLHFIAPLVVLLSRRAKQNRRALAIVASLLLAAQVLQTAWVILPSTSDAPRAMPWLALVLTVALGGLFANRYLISAAQEETAR